MPDRAPLSSARALATDLWQLGRGGIVRTGALVALGSLVEGLGILLLVPLLGTLMASAPVGEPGSLQRISNRLFAALHLSTPQAQLLALLAAMGTLLLLRAAVIWARDAALARLQLGFVATLRLRVARQLAQAPWERVVRLRHARVTHLFGEDMQRIGAAAQQLLTVLVVLATLGVQAAVALMLAPLPASFALAGLGLGAWGLRRLMTRARDEGGAVMRGNLALIDWTAQFLGGLKLAASQNLQPAFLQAFETMQDAVRTRQLVYARQQTRGRLTASLLSFAVGGAALLIGQALAMPGATLIAMLLLIARMGSPAAQVQQAVQQLAFSLPAYDRIGHLERDLGSASMPEGPVPAPDAFDGPIVFDRVRFAHPDAGGLERVELRIEPGTIVALTGPSGSGKTSMADLAAGLLFAQAGAVRVGTVELTRDTAHGWREQVGYAGQDPFLSHAAIRDALRWGSPHADDPALWEVLETVGAGARVRRFPQGLDTLVGERGGLLSGGERQRLAIARALLRRPKLLILDEATSGLDPASERALLMRIRALPMRPTVLLITHRMDNLDLCDRVCRLAEGQIVPETHHVDA